MRWTGPRAAGILPGDAQAADGGPNRRCAMPLSSRLVCRADVGALCDLGVRADQGGRVAPNARTIAQAAYEPGAHVWGLWEEDTPVGLLALIDQAEADLDDGDEPRCAFLWRLMVDGAHQGRGFGAAALRIAAARARAWGKPRLVTSAVDVPGGAAAFYERHGFGRTGRVIDDEVELVRDL